MRALKTFLMLLAAMCCLAFLSGCSTTGNAADREAEGIYNRGGIHSNSFPGTFGGYGAYYRYGRPSYRY
jgi:hypothetical protein